MACGHDLIHYKQQCKTETPCTIPPTTFLDDTCGPCHPSHMEKVLDAEFDDALQTAIAGVTEATATGNLEKKARVTELVAKLSQDHLEQVQKLDAQRRYCDEDVLWPGKVEEDGLNSGFQVDHQRVLLREEYNGKKRRVAEGLEIARKSANWVEYDALQVKLSELDGEYERRYLSIAEPEVHTGYDGDRQRGLLCVTTKGRVEKWLDSL